MSDRSEPGEENLLSQFSDFVARKLQPLFPSLFQETTQHVVTTLEPHYIEFLKKQSLVQGLTPEEFLLFSTFIQVKHFPSGVDLIKEGEKSLDIYFLYEGEVTLHKWDITKEYELPIGKLEQGTLFGEMSFIDNEPRSTTVRTAIPSTILHFNPELIHKNNLKMRGIYDAILLNTAKNSITRLRSTNQDFVQSLRSQIDFGYFFILSIVIFGIGNLLVVLATEYHYDAHAKLFSWFSILIFLIPYLILIKKFRLPWNAVGVTTQNWKQSTVEGLIISLGFCVVVSFAYWMYTFFDPDAKPLLEAILHPPVPLDFFIILYLFQSYLQEFMARGITQSSLQKFLKDTNGFKALILTSLMFAIFHSARGLDATAAAFFGSMIFGYIYLRHKNLIGVSIVHYVVGVISINYLELV